MRRVLALAALVAAAAVLVTWVEAPRRRTGREMITGPSVLRLVARDVHAITATVGDRRFAAVRDGAGWRVDGVPAQPALAEAVDDLVETLAGLRAVQAFRSDDVRQFGLDAPGGSIVVEGPHGRRTLALGRFDSVGSALYARRDGDPRVFLVGAALGSAVERVFYRASEAREPAAGT